MLLVLHCFAGAPLKRPEGLHRGWGVPIPDADQRRVADEYDDLLALLSGALEKHGLQNANALGFDDAGSMFLELRRQIQAELQAFALLRESAEHVRTGINATGRYIDIDEAQVILRFTGRHHADEMVDRLLEHRRASSRKLVSLTDAASKSFSHDHADPLEQAVCNAHCYPKIRAVNGQLPAKRAVAGEVHERVFVNDDKAKAFGVNSLMETGQGCPGSRARSDGPGLGDLPPRPRPLPLPHRSHPLRRRAAVGTLDARRRLPLPSGSRSPAETRRRGSPTGCTWGEW